VKASEVSAELGHRSLLVRPIQPHLEHCKSFPNHLGLNLLPGHGLEGGHGVSLRLGERAGGQRDDAGTLGSVRLVQPVVVIGDGGCGREPGSRGCGRQSANTLLPPDPHTRS